MSAGWSMENMMSEMYQHVKRSGLFFCICFPLSEQEKWKQCDWNLHCKDCQRWLAQSARAGIQDHLLYMSWLKEACGHKHPKCICLEMSSKMFTIYVILNFENVYIFFLLEQGFLKV